MQSDNDDLEALVGRELRRLRPPRAPHTLLPRVMEAVEAWADRPWYTRAWFAWPLVWKIASLVPLLFVAYAGWQPPAAPESVVAATSVSRVLWEAVVQPLLPYILMVVVLMGLACAAFGVALNYVLLERAEQR